MKRKYFEVEIEYVGTKIFHINISDMMTHQEALEYIAKNYNNLEHDYNEVMDDTDYKIIAINYREEK
jgi:hypothetical protein